MSLNVLTIQTETSNIKPLPVNERSTIQQENISRHMNHLGHPDHHKVGLYSYGYNYPYYGYGSYRGYGLGYGYGYPYI